MRDDTTTSGMLGSSGTLGQVGRTGGPISWPRVLRDAEGNQSGANGGSGGASGAGTATGSSGASGAAAGSSATGASGETPDAEDTTGLKTALKTERQAAKDAAARAEAAEKRIAELEAGTQSDAEKAVTAARREAASERDAHWKARIRAAEVRGALRGQGIVDDEALELALGHTRFRDLKVDSESGGVEGLPEAVEAFKKSAPWAFKTEAGGDPTNRQGGSWGGSEGGNNRKEPGSLTEALEQHYANPKPR